MEATGDRTLHLTESGYGNHEGQSDLDMESNKHRSRKQEMITEF
jgi:hypothetical protein